MSILARVMANYSVTTTVAQSASLWLTIRMQNNVKYAHKIALFARISLIVDNAIPIINIQLIKAVNALTAIKVRIISW